VTTLPDWRPVAPPDSKTPPERPYTPSISSSAEKVAQSPVEVQIPVAAIGEYVPIIYGKRRVGPKIFWAGVSGGNVVLACAWCLGEIESIALKTSRGQAVTGITATHYYGTVGQVVDPTLAGLISGWAKTGVITWRGESLPIAYSVLQIPQGQDHNVIAEIEGKHVADPRGSTGYSANPALVSADLLGSNLYGSGRTVNEQSIIDAANYYDAQLNGKPRAEIHITIDRKQDVNAWVSEILRYGPMYLADHGEELYLVPDKPRTSARTIRYATSGSDLPNVIGKDPGEIKMRAMKSRPDVVVVDYTGYDTDGNEVTMSAWEYSTGAPETQVDWEVMRVSMPYMRDYSQARRYAKYLLGLGRDVQWEATRKTTDESLATTAGDRVELLDPRGGTMDMVVEGVRMYEVGRWELAMRSYAASMYSDATFSDPPVNPLKENLPSPRLLDPVTPVNDLLDKKLFWLP